MFADDFKEVAKDPVNKHTRSVGKWMFQHCKIADLQVGALAHVEARLAQPIIELPEITRCHRDRFALSAIRR